MSDESGASSALVLERRLELAWIGACTAFALEAAAVGSLAGACAIAAIPAGAPPSQRNAVVIVCAACACGGFALARRPRRSSFASALDDRLGFAGALAAAAGARGRSAIARLLAHGIVARLPLARALVVAVPSILAGVVALVLAWALVRESAASRVGDGESGAHATALVEASAVELERAVAAARARGTLSSDEARRLTALAAESRANAEGPRGAPSAEDLARGLAEVASKPGVDPALHAASERLERALRASSAAAGGPAASTTPRPSPSEPTAGAGASALAPGRDSAADGLAGPPASGTMSGSLAPVEASSSESLASPHDDEGGVGAARWWPRRHDAVVERWLADRAATSEGRASAVPSPPSNDDEPE